MGLVEYAGVSIREQDLELPFETVETWLYKIFTEK